jgi:hypothetical protein
MIYVMCVLAAAAAVEAIGPGRAPQPANDAAIEETGLRQLLKIHRLFIDRLTGGETAAQMRDLLVSAIEKSKLFVITENQERADCFLRGTAEDLVFTDVHNTSDSVNARSNMGTSRSARSGGNYGVGSSDSITGGLGVGESETSHIEERKHESVAAVRLVNKDGDVIWSTTQESQGGKFHRASTDVAERIAKRLEEDYTRAKRLKPLTETQSIPVH